MSTFEKINIQIHPRAFAAFGEDLVTNDIVAIIELVKNSYDAYAFKVEIEIGEDEEGEKYISISDDGLGMDKETIINAWATIATPYKKKNPIVERTVEGEVKKRIVSGNKGLGRFSAARLGDEMIMITQSSQGESLKAYFDWKLFDNVENISECIMDLEVLKEKYFKETGTKIIIKKLKNVWTEENINDLISELSRLITPFKAVSDFEIELTSPYNNSGKVTIQTEKFIEQPVYKIEGKVTEEGTINYNYFFDNGKTSRQTSGSIAWSEDNYKEAEDLLNEKVLPAYTCGKFSFELRVWDLDSESIQDIAERFSIKKKRSIRHSIGMYKGISVYRDNVLVLPKSEASRDWLGLDKKRISQLGRRISTSQVIGIIYISNVNNPEIKDTTDREKLADTVEYKQFVEVINNIVEALQRERLQDKTEERKKETLTDIIAPLSANALLENVEDAVKQGADAEEILDYVRGYQQQNEKQLLELNERLVYYAQTASLGSVAIVIMHEFLTGMTCIKRFLNKIKSRIGDFEIREKEYFEDAERSHKRIVEVTESFAPLYKRDLRKQRYKVCLNDALEKSIRLIKSKKVSKGVVFETNLMDDLFVTMSESELQTVFINLFDNACYWLTGIPEGERRIWVELEKKEEDRIVVSISDNGKGIQEEDAEKIFIPGVTSKPKGIGMGLVITTEIIKSYDGAIGVRIPGDKGGATFVVELPLRKE